MVRPTYAEQRRKFPTFYFTLYIVNGMQQLTHLCINKEPGLFHLSLSFPAMLKALNFLLNYLPTLHTCTVYPNEVYVFESEKRYRHIKAVKTHMRRKQVEKFRQIVILKGKAIISDKFREIVILKGKTII
jgi:hypothetical protein